MEHYEYYKAKSAFNQGRFDDARLWYKLCSKRHQRILREWKKDFAWN